MDDMDIDYYRSRERKARTLAMAATNPAVASIHLAMADSYDAIVQAKALSGRPPAARLSA